MEGGLQEGSQGTVGPTAQMLLPSPHPGHPRDPHSPRSPPPSPPDGLSLLPCEASPSTGALGPSPLACSLSCTEHVPSCKHTSPSGDETPIWLRAGQRLGWPPPPPPPAAELPGGLVLHPGWEDPGTLPQITALRSREGNTLWV